MAARPLASRASAWGRHAVLIGFAVLSFYPILVMWFTALRPKSESMRDPFGLPSTLYLDNLTTAWTRGRFGDYFLNSIIITVPSVVGVVVLSALAGYGIARFRFRGRMAILYLILLGLTVPFQSVMIPLYYQLLAMGLLGTYLAVILPLIAFGLPFGVFLMQSFFEDLPQELHEAGRADGCSELRIFWSIMLPLARPAISTLIVFQFMRSWNEFLMPLLYLQREELRPIPLGLMFFQGAYVRDIGLIAAGVTLATIPVIVVYLIFQRQFVRGLTAGAVK
ncbi:MAG TPA: carbohydrate ABC transporter permease [Rubellimicrobium sp.]|jgi:ABC-type glycerol-3-phosphate transport system permease component|nr:carbohydrate ABC transporter permease [Rubellimicrobium sp.]